MVEVDSVTIDTSEMIASLKQLEQHAAITAQTVLSTTKKGYQSLILLADIFGVALPMMFTLLIEATFMAGTVFAEFATAETLSGWFALKAGITFAISTMMFYRALQLQAQKSEVENKLNSIMQLGNIW